MLGVEVMVGLFSSLVLHEAGHWLAARALGGSDVRLRRDGWLGARVEATFPEQARARRAVFFAAGSVANLAAAALALALWVPLAAGIHMAFALLSMVPTTGSDGASLLSLVRRRS